ncbi:rRNA-processing protein FCF1 like [Glycine soja]|nr:rRNA-processing protein FCF1 like [Glycine soja]
MGKAKKGPKFAVMKKIVTSKAIKSYKEEVLNPEKKNLMKEKLPRNVPTHSSALFFQYNTALGPPYRVLVDTNFINFSIQNKFWFYIYTFTWNAPFKVAVCDMELIMFDFGSGERDDGLLICKIYYVVISFAKIKKLVFVMWHWHCTPCITDCVMAELEKLGQKYRVALRIAKDPRFERILCTHKGTYADDCLVERVTQHKCYIVATCDRDLKRRIRKIPGVPIMYITKRKYSIERLPEATIGGGRYSYLVKFIVTNMNLNLVCWTTQHCIALFRN